MMNNNEFYQKKEKLKQLFYTELTGTQIKQKLQITNNEYNKLLVEVKKELGLPTTYHRLPKNLNIYGEDKYYIAEKTNNNDFQVLMYFPTVELANQKLNDYQKTNTENNFFIAQATKKHMLENIEKDYFEKEQKWDTIMLKYKLSYHKFYELLNEIKKQRNVNGSRTASRLRYIVPTSHDNWLIRKTLNGKKHDYGFFNNLEETIRIRDYLESINWDKNKWELTKEKIIEDKITEWAS